MIDDVPHGHWKTTTFLAPMVVDGAINGELFLAYVQQILLPTLKSGDIVVFDSLSSHKVAPRKYFTATVGYG